MNSYKHTYISLFSSAGVGCFGFKQEDFECIVTNELVPRRLDVQRFNSKCKYDSGYICGDITEEIIKQKIDNEVKYWQKHENCNDVDVIIATPPCQGMSVANNKKSKNDIIRNSLVIESINIIKNYMPKFFIFENVPSFMKTICTDIDGVNKQISEAIQNNLGTLYSYTARKINFKDYGACSSRSRTLVIGVRSDYADFISPYEIFPNRMVEKTLRNVIGNLKQLTTMGEIDPDDIYHSFRTYPEHMRKWISGISEGKSAFDNPHPNLRPHQIIGNSIVPNQQKNGDKYRRQVWEKVGPCVHTRNDQLASQNTIHPEDDRVFSIRELMLMMTIPTSFKWSAYDLNYLNQLTINEKQQYLKKEEIKIRQCLGEAVPTHIFQVIAQNIKNLLSYNYLTSKQLNTLIQTEDFSSLELELSFLKDNKLGLSVTTLMQISELINTRRTETSAYYTNKSIITEILNRLPDTTSNSIRILEPSVGVGNFLPLIFKKFDDKHITIDIVDIDDISIKKLNLILEKLPISEKVKLNIIHSDFLSNNFNTHYDYIIGNPPFGRISNTNKNLKLYQQSAINKSTKNIFSFFLDKCVNIGKCIALVLPKSILNTPEFAATRSYLSNTNISSIIDFGEKGFNGVLIETIALVIQPNRRPTTTEVYSINYNHSILQTQSYITDKSMPYWVIYRNSFFDVIASKLTFGCFDVFRDRQITNSILQQKGEIRIIKSRNINDDGSKILSIPDYDAYISSDIAKNLAVYKFLDSDNIYMTPNMTYKPRVISKPKGCLVNGSVALLIPKNNIILKPFQLNYFSTEEYRKFYQIARNFQTRSLNIDSASVYFFGLVSIEEENHGLVK
jgi:DNA (cytosine-5)-methyltransferase 1